MAEATIRDGVLQVRRPGGRWLGTGWNGGYLDAAGAYNITVPDPFERTDLDGYVQARRTRAGFDEPGPALLTGVAMEHARGARADPVTVFATEGLSNPADLPIGSPGDTGSSRAPDAGSPGTVNLITAVDRHLDDGGLATLLAVVVEAKAATLMTEAGFPGTTTDAVIVGGRPTTDPASFSGSATRVGAAARACVREAVGASLASRYPDTDWPSSVADADHGVRTERQATVFTPTADRCT